MSKKNSGRECLHGVCCSVENCTYHAKGGMCTAESIDVKNENALTKAETFCGTFTPIESWQV